MRNKKLDKNTSGEKKKSENSLKWQGTATIELISRMEKKCKIREMPQAFNNTFFYYQ